MKTLNPYRYMAGALRDRLTWDMRPVSWRSRNKIKQWRNTHVGEKCVIMCNGPSLLKSDLSLLENVFTFGLNKINLAFEKMSKPPSVIVAVNQHVLDQNQEFYNQTDIPLFLDSYAARTNLVKERDNLHFLHSFGWGFAEDVSISVNQGHTVTYVAMQLAFHMGFKQVALIGADHYFNAKGYANEAQAADKVDVNHFDPNYFANGVIWQLPDIPASELYYTTARDRFQQHGRKIWNCTEGGHLEIFERTSLQKFLE